MSIILLYKNMQLKIYILLPSTKVDFGGYSFLYSFYTKKLQKKIVLNKSHHVHKKAKERFQTKEIIKIVLLSPRFKNPEDLILFFKQFFFYFSQLGLNEHHFYFRIICG